jgi:DNA invertase Pin-like site-specific DNA recombinase
MTLDRPKLRKLIADCHAGKIGMVLTADPERLSRDVGQLTALLETFHKAGVHVEFTACGGRTRFEFQRIALSAVAQFGATENA